MGIDVKRMLAAALLLLAVLGPGGFLLLLEKPAEECSCSMHGKGSCCSKGGKGSCCARKGPAARSCDGLAVCGRDTPLAAGAPENPFKACLPGEPSIQAAEPLPCRAAWASRDLRPQSAPNPPERPPRLA